MTESTPRDTAEKVPEEETSTPEVLRDSDVDGDGGTTTAHPAQKPRLFGMRRWLAISVLAVAMAIVLAITSVVVANAIQDYNESRDKAFASYESAFAAYESSVDKLGSTVSTAERELLATNESQLTEASIRTYLEGETTDAEGTLIGNGGLPKVDFESLSNDEIEDEITRLNKAKTSIASSESYLAKATTSLIRDKEEKFKADEEARKAAELAVKKASAAPVAYEDLFRAGDAVLGTYYRFEGKIIQDAGAGTYRVNMTKDPGYSMIFWEDTILVTVLGATSQRLLEDDLISFTAFSGGITSYETIFGATVELPSVMADGADIAVVGRDS